MIEFDFSYKEYEAFQSLQSNKGECVNKINVNVVKSVFDLIKSLRNKDMHTSGRSLMK